MGSGRVLKVSIEITHRGSTPATVGKRQINRWKKEGLRSMAWRWHNLFREQHFTSSGARKYRYTPRKTKHIFSGQVKYFGGKPRAPDGRPLVWSGTSQQIATHTRVVATSKWSEARYQTRAFNFRPYLNPAINMNEEFTKVLGYELLNLTKNAEKVVRRRIRSYKRVLKVRIKP